MIARTLIRVMVGFSLLGWSITRLAPRVVSDRNAGIVVGVLLILAGGVTVAVRLFAPTWVEAQTTKAKSYWGYPAPVWARDMSGLVMMLVGLCLFAWWAN
jgi:hypothetical protein